MRFTFCSSLPVKRLKPGLLRFARNDDRRDTRTTTCSSLRGARRRSKPETYDLVLPNHVLDSDRGLFRDPMPFEKDPETSSG